MGTLDALDSFVMPSSRTGQVGVPLVSRRIVRVQLDGSFEAALGGIPIPVEGPGRERQ